jgi:hypothetical protein
MSLVTFGFPVEDLAARLRVMAAVSDDNVKLVLPPFHLRQIAARLDLAVSLQEKVAGLEQERVAEVAANIYLRTLCARLLLWNIGLFLVALISTATLIAGVLS